MNKFGPAVPNGQQPAWDLEYDLAHEGRPDINEGEQVPPEPVHVATETPAYDGDYGYDLAHDLPGA
jgi:hypothetical protein